MKFLILDKKQWEADLKEAEHILKYTLLLPAPAAIVDTDQTSWISSSLDLLFSNCISNVFYPPAKDFFGQNLPTYEFSELPPTSYWKRESLFPKTLLLHCVIYAYSVLNSLTSSFQTTYSSVNMNFESELSKNDTTLKAAEATRLSNRIKRHLSVMDRQSFPQFFNIKKSTQIETSQAALFHSIMNFEAREFESVLRLYNYNENNSTTRKVANGLMRAAELYKQLIEQAPDDTPEKILWFYSIENIFGFDLLSEILSGIKNLKVNNREYPDGINSYRILACANCLPNSLYRPLYIRYAFSAINQEISQQSYFFGKLFDFTAMLEQFDSKILNIHTWHIFFEQFCRFFSDFVCPVVEWYFMLTLVKTVKENLPESSAEEQANTLKSLLRKYMIEHEKDFFVSNAKELEKRFDDSLDAVPPCDISKLLTEFRNSACGSNLLTPKLTLTSCVANDNKNRQRIMGNYITFSSTTQIANVPSSMFPI